MKRTVIVAVVLAVAVLAAALLLPGSRSTPKRTTQFGLPAGCKADASSSLSSYFTNLPNNDTVTLPHNACFTVLSTVQIANTSGLTINGNGATFYQSSPYSDSGHHEVLFLTENTNLTIRNLNLVGSYNGSNGGPAREETSGILAEANQTLTLSGINVTDVQGDFVILQAPFDVGGGAALLNTNVRVVNSHFTSAGYHGVVVEGVGPTKRNGNGATFSNDLFDGMQTDAIDLEYDIYSSGTPDANGIATYAAEDDVTFSGNTFANFSDDWFASLQGQTPGVQEYNVVLTGNKITGTSTYDLGDVEGTAQASTTSLYIFNGLTITNNTAVAPAYPTHGGAITTKNVGSTLTLANVSNVHISGNHFLLFDGFTNYFFNTPYMAFIQANGILGLTVQNNNLSGAYDVLHPSSGSNSYGAFCGNYYGVNGASLDTSC